MNRSQENMDTESTSNHTEGESTQSPIRNIEEMQRQLNEINKVSSPLPDFMLTPKEKGKASKPIPPKSTDLVLRTPPPGEKTLMGSFWS